jgi:hypothetical protein
VAVFGVFYDANVLYPSELRNLLMHLALTGLSPVRGTDPTYRTTESRRQGCWR